MTLQLAAIVAQTNLILLDIAYTNSDASVLKYLMTPRIKYLHLGNNMLNMDFFAHTPAHNPAFLYSTHHLTASSTAIANNFNLNLLAIRDTP
jgi:hypothetical protein